MSHCIISIRVRWYVMVFQLYLGGGNRNYLPQVTDKLYHILNVISSTPRLNGIRTHNVSGDRHLLHR